MSENIGNFIGLLFFVGLIIFILVTNPLRKQNKTKTVGFVAYIIKTKQNFIRLAKKSPAWFLFCIGYVMVYAYSLWNLVISILIDLRLVRRYMVSDLLYEKVYNHYDHYILIWIAILIFLSLVLYGLTNIKFNEN